MDFFNLLRYMPSIFMPAYGSEWFAGCTNKDDDCEFDYTSYQFYNSLFLSVRGLVSLLFAGFIGRLSDSYGRKWFLLLNVFINFLPYAFLAVVYDLWLYYIFYSIVGLNGSNNSATPVMAAYVSDTLPIHLRTVGYGALYCTAGVGLILGLFYVNLLYKSVTNNYFVSILNVCRDVCARILTCLDLI